MYVLYVLTYYKNKNLKKNEKKNYKQRENTETAGKSI